MAQSPLITLRTVEPDRERLRAAAADRQMTVSALIRHALAEQGIRIGFDTRA
jgi:hypothetical protein